MRRRNPLSTLATGLVIAACAPGDDAYVADTDAVRQELTARMAAYKEAIMSGDAERSLDFWASDARVLEPGVDMSREQFGEFVRDFFATGRVVSLDIEAYDQFVHGAAAYEVGEYDETMEVQGDQQTLRNYYFLRWERGDDGEWRIDRFVAGPREAPSGM